MKLLFLLRPFFMFLQVAWVPWSHWLFPGRPMLSDREIVILHSASTGSVREIAIVTTVSDSALRWELTWPTACRPRPSSPGPGSHPWPGSDLRRPGVTDTGHSPSSPATLPYSVSPLTPQHSSKYCTIFGDKDKTTGSFTINILKILAYCCTI